MNLLLPGHLVAQDYCNPCAFTQSLCYLLLLSPCPTNTHTLSRLAYIFFHPLTLTLYEAPEKMVVLFAAFPMNVNPLWSCNFSNDVF